MDIAKRLKSAREIKGCTQTDVSKKIGINNKTLSGYERGISEPDLKTLSLLADFYSVSLDYLLGRTDDPDGEEIHTIAAHHAGDEFTDEEKQEIENFKKYVLSKRKK